MTQKNLQSAIGQNGDAVGWWQTPTQWKEKFVVQDYYPL